MRELPSKCETMERKKQGTQKKPPKAIPTKTGITCDPPFSPATKTSAQATPSGYGNSSLTIKILLKLIEKSTPIVPQLRR